MQTTLNTTKLIQYKNQLDMIITCTRNLFILASYSEDAKEHN